VFEEIVVITFYLALFPRRDSGLLAKFSHLKRLVYAVLAQYMSEMLEQQDFLQFA